MGAAKKKLAKGKLTGSERRGLSLRVLQRAKRYWPMIAVCVGASILAGASKSLPILLAKIVPDHLFAKDGGASGVLPAESGLDQWVRDTSSWVQNHFAEPGSDSRLPVLWLVMGLIVGSAVLSAIARFTNEYLAKYLAARVSRDLRVDLLARVVRFPMSEFTNRRMGDLLSRFTNDVQTTYLTVNIFISEILLQPVIIVIATVMMFLVNWQLAACAIVALPFISLPVLLLGKVVHRRSRRTLHTLSDTMESVNQVLSGMRTVKAFSMEEAEVQDFARVNDRWVQREASLVKVKAQGKAIMDLVYGISLAAMLGGGGWLIVHEKWGVTSGVIVSFMAAFATLYTPIRRLSVAYNKLQASLAGAQRVFEIIDSDIEVADHKDARPLSGIKQGIKFRNVSFAYPADTEATLEKEEPRPVLSDLSFDIPAGTTVALVGPSGAGKSTVADLLFRFFEPTAGEILVDGVALPAVARESLLKEIAVVSQQPFLFNTSVRENIAYGRPGATELEIIDAAKGANIHEEVLSLPEGYDTVVGDRGARLSGGQLQRLTIARALLKDAALLLLDEATSNLDTHSEKVVQKALSNLLKGRTALVIAHRLSTIQQAHTILVMQSGRIVERGSHAELSVANGPYQRLFEAQIDSGAR